MAEFGQLICPGQQVVDSGFRVLGEALRQDGQQVADVFCRIQAVGHRSSCGRIYRCTGLCSVGGRGMVTELQLMVTAVWEQPVTMLYTVPRKVDIDFATTHVYGQ